MVKVAQLYEYTKNQCTVYLKSMNFFICNIFQFLKWGLYHLLCYYGKEFEVFILHHISHRREYTPFNSPQRPQSKYYSFFVANTIFYSGKIGITKCIKCILSVQFGNYNFNMCMYLDVFPFKRYICYYK